MPEASVPSAAGGSTEPQRGLSFVPLVGFGISFGLSAWAAVVFQSSPFGESPLVDEWHYVQWARRIAQGAVIPDQPFFMDPLYAYFLGGLFAINESLLWARLAQCALAALIPVQVWFLTRRLYGNRAAAAATFLLAFYGALHLQAVLLLKEILACIAGLACAWWLVRGIDTGRLARFAWAGAAAGAMTLARGNAMLVFAGASAAMVWASRRDVAWRKRALTFIAGGLLFLGPVAVNNWRLSGAPFITYNGGLNFYLGNGQYATGAYPEVPFIKSFPEAEDRGFQVEAERRAGRPLARAEASRLWYLETLRELAADPPQLPRILLRKLLLLFGNQEIPDHYDFDCTRREFVPSLWLGAVEWWLVFAFAAAGIFATRWTPGHRWVLLTAALYALSVELFFVLSRIRMPLVPFAAVFAGHGFAALIDALKARDVRQAAWVTLVGSAAAAFAIFPAPLQQRTRTDYAHCCHMSGTLLMGRGNLEGALPLLTTAAELAPDSDDNLYNLGLAHQLTGGRDEAERLYRRVLEQHPAHPKALYNLGLVLLAGGNPREAEQDFLAAIAAGLESAELFGALGQARENQGALDTAAKAYRTALERNPRQPDVVGRLLVLTAKAEGCAQARTLANTLNAEALRIPAELQASLSERCPTPP